MHQKKPELITILVLGFFAGCSFNSSSQSAKGGDQTQGAGQAPTVAVTTVVSQTLNRQIRLPGEIAAFQDVALYPKVPGFVEWIGPDRGSVMKRGQLMIRLNAPELAAQRNQAEAHFRAVQAQLAQGQAKFHSTQAQKLEAAAKLAASDATYRRLKAASATPGVVAGNELELAQRAVEAEQARVRLFEEYEKAAQAEIRSLEENARAAQEAARSVQDIESYLRVIAPFDGIVTERNVHVGSLVGPAASPTTPPMLRIQQVSTLRLTVFVPETDVEGVAAGAKANFSVPAYPGETFNGTVSRIAHALDMKTRTMPVELDVANAKGRLAPGMFAEVAWTTKRTRPSLMVPSSTIATTTERIFVLRIRNNTVEWIDVKRGAAMGGLVEVFGDLREGDLVALRGTDELRPGTRVLPKKAS